MIMLTRSSERISNPVRYTGIKDIVVILWVLYFTLFILEASNITFFNWYLIVLYFY